MRLLGVLVPERVVCGCGKPVRDNAQLCHACTERLRRDLGEVRGLADEIETTQYGQSRMGGQPIGGGHSADRPLPFDDRPVLAARALREVCRRWTTLVVEQRGVGQPRDFLIDYGPFLLSHVDWLRHREEAPVLHAELVDAIGRVRGSIDRRAERLYAGPCGSVDYDEVTGLPDPACVPCPADLYGRPTAKTVRCDVCGTCHDTADRREWLLEAARDQLAHPSLLSKALSNLMRPVPEKTITSWKDRGQLVAHGVDLHGRKLYRVGDVMDLMVASAERQAALAAKPSKKRKAG